MIPLLAKFTYQNCLLHTTELLHHQQNMVLFNTGANPLAVYDVDISVGNVRLMATRTTANSTQYKISETLIVA